MIFDSVKDNVRELLFQYSNSLDNNTLVRLYWQRYDLGKFTSCESITRAKRYWTRLAKQAFINGCREDWVQRLIPTNERLIEIRSMENKYKEAFQ